MLYFPICSSLAWRARADLPKRELRGRSFLYCPGDEVPAALTLFLRIMLHVVLRIHLDSDLTPRTPQHLRPDSHYKGSSVERAFRRKIERKDVGRYLQAVERFQRKFKTAGQRFGPLGAYGEKVFRALVRLVAWGSPDGRLDPTLETIAEKVNCCISAVVHALKLLKQHGFVDWIRRYTEVDQAATWGPQVHQTSNAYRLALPAAAADLADRPMTDEDHQAKTKARAAEIREYDAQSNGVGDALDKLGRAIIQRDLFPRKT